VLADLPAVPGRLGSNLSQREAIRRTLATGKPVISSPVMGATTRQPLVLMTAPIFGPDGKIVAILGGTIYLLKPNFLGNLSTAKIGKTGYFYILTKEAAPVVVIHPRKDIIMLPAPGAAQNPSTAKAMAGFEGTLEGTNSKGMPGLFSYKSLQEVNWLLASVLPADEAFGEIDAAETKIRNIMIALSLLLAPLIWWLAYWRLRPLQALRANIQAMRGDPREARELAVTSRDEIGALTREFNDLMRERRGAMDALIASEERFRTITDNLPALIGYVDRDQRYRFNNQTYEEWFGIERGALIGMTMREVLGEQEYAKVADYVTQALDGYSVTHEREVTLRGRTRFVAATYLPHYGQHHEVLGFYILLSDISDRKAAESQLSHMAHHDALTGLPNRILFNETLVGAIHRGARTNKLFALMYLDIDHFKAVNDTLGHGVGDQLLKAFAARLAETVRARDTVARLGGDEFVVIAEDLALPEDARLIARKINQAMAQPFQLGAVHVRASASIGVAICTSGEGDPDSLLKKSDAALYRAKSKGRNTFEVMEMAPAAVSPEDPENP
jgi:diguanylate cyclase (GGDEF)-like protein/PAS domain S-box-containing protein